MNRFAAALVSVSLVLAVPISAEASNSALAGQTAAEAGATVAPPSAASPQGPSPQAPLPQSPWTVESIFGQGSPSGDPPSGFAWSPDSKRAFYRSDDGDILGIDDSGKRSIMISHTRLNVLSSVPSTETDRDHRARYGQPDFIWGPDSKHLLLDTAGEAVLYSPDTMTGLDVASTGSGSGDDPKFSPNGAFVSYIRNHNLYVRRMREQGQEVSLTAPHDREGRHGFRLGRGRDSEEYDGDQQEAREGEVRNGEVDWVYEEELDVRSNYFWSPDSRRLAYLQMDESAVPKYPIADWVPTHAGVDQQPYPQPGDPNPAVRVGVVSVDGGKTSWIKVPLDRGNDYIPRFGWVNSETVWIETLTRDHQHLALYFANAETGQIRLALAQTDDKFFDEAYNVEFATSDFFLTSWRDGHTHIYRYGFNPTNPLLTDVRLVGQLTSGPYEVASIASIDEPSKTVYYVSNEGDPLGQQVWAIGWDGQGKQKLSSTPGFHTSEFAPEGGAYIDTASDAGTPPSVSLCHKSECKLLWNSTALASTLAPAERLELKAADGATTLYGWLLLPSAEVPSPRIPLIVNPYGGPGVRQVRDAWGNSSRLFDELLTQHGYAVLHVDNRGMGGRGRDFAQVAYRNFGPIQLADQLVALDQVLAKYPQLDRQRLGLWGWSWGGTLTLNALTHSDRFRAGVAVAPVTDWRNYDSIYTERYMGLPAANSDGYRDDSVVNNAANLKGHLLMVQGTGDDNVHLGNSVQFIQKLIDADLPYDFQIYPRKTHSIRGAAVRVHLYNRILAHFDTYLKPLPGGQEKP